MEAHVFRCLLPVAGSARRCRTYGLEVSRIITKNRQTGALIPYIEADYNITYSVVSLIFITYAIGFLSVAPVVHALDSKLGRSWFHVLTVASMSIGYIMLIPAPPYPVVVVAFWFLGFGAGGNLATLNSWTVNLLHGTLILSFMQALYGVSAMQLFKLTSG